eukprot:Gb_35546 [translate_table: standard]
MFYNFHSVVSVGFPVCNNGGSSSGLSRASLCAPRSKPATTLESSGGWKHRLHLLLEP